tara:strand:+ start:346 stop:507 length:162 start_codon:yes stop_codon:yes gene_type:complete
MKLENQRNKESGLTGELPSPNPVFVTMSFKISDLTRNKKQEPHIFCNGLKLEI